MSESPTIELPEGDPDAVMGASRSLGQLGAAVDSVGHAVGGARASVGSWQGRASAAFGALADEYQVNAQQLVEIATVAAVTVRRFAEVLREARQEVRRLRRAEEDCLDRIRTWKERLEDAQLRADDARARIAAAFDAGLDADPFSLAAQAAAQMDLDRALADITTATRQLDDARDELERLRDAARRERQRAQDAERAAAAQVATLAIGLPGASMPGGPASAAGGAAHPVALSPFGRPFGGPATREQLMWERAMARAEAHQQLRDRLIDGGHIPPPGKLTPEEAQRFVEAHERNHGSLSAHESIALQGRLVQGERPPSLAKNAHLYEEPQWSKDLSEFLDVAAAAQMAAGPPGGVTGGITRLPNTLRRLPLGALRTTPALNRPFDEAERLASELWRRDLPTKQSSTSGQPWAKYEVDQTGPVNLQMKGGDKDPIWADGYRTDDGFVLEAKHVRDPDHSPYVHDSSFDPTRRAKVMARIDGEIERYAAVIHDDRNVARALEIITNEPRAVKTFEDLLAKHDVPGRVVVRP